MRGTSLSVTTEVSFRGTRMKKTFLGKNETVITFAASFYEEFVRSSIARVSQRFRYKYFNRRIIYTRINLRDTRFLTRK